MGEEIRCRPEDLGRLIAKHLQTLEKRAKNGLENAAEDGARAVESRAPKAFGDLRSSIHVVENPLKIVIDAPHAGAVEIGSPPHKPDIEALTAWVKLRGLQGLRNLRSSRLHGPTTRAQSQSVKEYLAQEVQLGTGGAFSPIDAPRRVAERIAKAIEKEGTEPHWYTRDSLPVIAMRVAFHMRRAMKKG